MLFGGLWAESWKPSSSSSLSWRPCHCLRTHPAICKPCSISRSGNFESVPSSPSTEELYRILVLADKYALSRKLGPWVSRWLKAIRDRLEEEVRTEERVWMMRIDWNLGVEKLYLMQLKDFIELVLSQLLLNPIRSSKVEARKQLQQKRKDRNSRLGLETPANPKTRKSKSGCLEPRTTTEI